MATISQAQPGDIVECEIRGWRFLARVEEVQRDEEGNLRLRIEPDKRNVTNRYASAQDVIGVYRKLAKIKPARIVARKLVRS